MYLWRVLRAMLFAGRMALSPSPVDIGGEWVSLAAPESMKALNDGAWLAVDVTRDIPVTMGLEAVWVASKAKFPPGCVEARIRLVHGGTVELRNGGTLVGKAFVELSLRPAGTWPGNSEFSTVDIRASCPIAGAAVSFQNAGE